jgi:uncharacterized membrane protein
VSKCIKIIPYLLAIISGIFLGQFSCGGYAWHKQATIVVVALATLLVVLFPMQKSPISLRLGFIIGAVVVFVLAESSSAAFYPAAPESWSEFLKSFVVNLESGAC